MRRWVPPPQEVVQGVQSVQSVQLGQTLVLHASVTLASPPSHGTVVFSPAALSAKGILHSRICEGKTQELRKKEVLY